MALLSIVQDAWARLGIEEDVPAAVAGSSNATVRVMLALSTQDGRELAARATWQALTREQSFTTVAQTVQTSAIPADFARLIPETAWNYTQDQRLYGPLSPQEWQALSAGLASPPDLSFRIRANDLLIIPDPPAGETVKFEYVSSYWVDTNADGVGEAAGWVSDTNTALLSEELLTLGVMWRWLKRNRLPYQDEFQEYKVAVDQAISRDGGRGTINMRGRAMPTTGVRVPDGSWNLP